MPGLDKMRESKSEEQSEALESADGFATAAAFKNRFKTGTYTLQDGLTIKFREMLPVDRQTFNGSALTTQMIEARLKDVNDPETRQQYLDSLSSLARIELVTEAAKDVIIQLVIEPQFTALSPEQCPPNKVSILELSPTEILEIDAAIREFSGGGEAEETFREASETDAEDTGESDAGGEAEHADGGTDGEGVSPEPV